MATSGSIDSGGYQGRVLRFSWSIVNGNTISYTVKAVGGSSSIYYHHNETVEINGTRVYTGGDSHAVKTGDVLASGTIVIDNGTLTVKMHGGIYVRTDNINTESSWTIVQAPTINSLTLNKKSVNSITCDFKVNKADTFYYKLSTQNSWQRGSNNVTNGTFTISNLEPNKSYTINFLARNWISEDAGTYQDSTKDIAISTYDIAKLTEVPNINIGKEHTIKWSNPSGATTSLKLCKTDNSQIADYGTVTGTSKSITQTASTIYALTPNSNTYTARYIITTTANNTSYTSYKDFTFTVTNSNPTAGTLEYKDTNATTVAITENNQRIVRNISTLQFILGAATAKNSASISKYAIEINGVKKERTSAGTLDFGTINVTYNTKAKLTVTDSRGNTATKEITVIVDDWVLPTALISLSRLNNYEDETYLTVDGSYSSVNNKNRITIQYQYKKNDPNNATSYSEWITINDNVEQTLSLAKEFSWLFNVKVSDKFKSTVYENILLAIGMPMTFYDTNLLSLGVNCFPKHPKSLEVEGTLQVNGDILGNLKGNADTATKSINATNAENATVANRVNSRGVVGPESGGNQISVSGISMSQAYNNSYPDSFGNILNLKGAGSSQLFLGWKGNSNIGKIAYRSLRDYTGDGTVWSSWGEIFTAKTLYDNSSGTTGTVTLNETAANFSYLEIYYFSDLNNDYGSVRIASPNGKKFRVSWNEMSKNSLNTDSYTFGTQFQVNGTSISVYNTSYGIINLGNATFYKQNRTKIHKVIGYR